MNDDSLKRLTDEMSRKPAVALLPRNVPNHWLDLLIEEADHLFPDSENRLSPPPETDGAPGLLFCVMKILHDRQKELHREPEPITIEEKKLLEYMDTYAFSLRLERISRQTDMKVKDTSTLANIFNRNRPMSFTRVQDS